MKNVTAPVTTTFEVTVEIINTLNEILISETPIPKSINRFKITYLNFHQNIKN